MIYVKDGVSLKELVESVVETVWNKYSSAEPAYNVENQEVDDQLAQLARRQLFTRELSESFKDLSDKLGKEITETLKASPEMKTIRLPDCGYKLTVAETVDLEIDHKAMDPFLKRNGLYDLCLVEKLNPKKITVAMIKEHFPEMLQADSISREFSTEKFSELVNQSKIRIEEVQPYIKDATKYTLTRRAHTREDEDKLREA